MSEILEIVMLVSFGFSWPLNLAKSIRSRSTKGISLTFYLLIAAGYVCGIASKLSNTAFMATISSKWYVLAVYIVNLSVVTLNILVYFLNRRREKKGC